MCNGKITSQPNHISHYINSNITSEEFISLLNRKESSSPAAGDLLSQLSTKMSDMMTTSNGSTQQVSSGTPCLADLPNFELPWSKVLTTLEPSVDLAINNDNNNCLTSYSPLSVQHAVCSQATKSSLDAKANGGESNALVFASNT